MGERANEFWRDVDDILLEEEAALDDFRAYLDALSVEDAEMAVYGLMDYLHELEHPVVEELVMGWERRLMDDS